MDGDGPNARTRLIWWFASEFCELGVRKKGPARGEKRAGPATPSYPQEDVASVQLTFVPNLTNCGLRSESTYGRPVPLRSLSNAKNLLSSFESLIPS